jgi:hypothetical protein
MRKHAYPLTSAILAVATLAATAGFWRVFTGDTWIVPLLAMVLSIHLLSWWFRRTNTPFSIAVIATVIVIVLVSIWTVLPASTSHGIPWTTTWDSVQGALDRLGNSVPRPPVHPDAGYLLEALWLVGIAAALADMSAFRVGSTLQAIVPAIAIFAFCQVLGGSAHGTVLIATLTGALAAYLLAHRATVGQSRAMWLGGQPKGYLGRVVKAGIIGVIAATLVAIGIGSQLPKSAALGTVHRPPTAAAPPPSHTSKKATQVKPASSPKPTQVTTPSPHTPPATAPRPTTAPARSPVSASRNGQRGVGREGPVVKQDNTPVWVIVLLVVLLALATWVAANVGYRQIRWRRRRRGDGDPSPAYSARVAWAELTETLALWNLRRERAETRLEFAQRVGKSLTTQLQTTSHRTGAPDGEDARRLTLDPPRVAAIVDRATFSDGTLPPDLAQSAIDMTEQIVRSLRAQASIQSKLLGLVDPWRSWMVGRID